MDMSAERSLAATIVTKAIEDWRYLVETKAWRCAQANPNRNFNEIRVFFNSDWCNIIFDSLCIGTTPEEALEMLEKELEEAKNAYGAEISDRGKCNAMRIKAVESGREFESIAAAARAYNTNYSCIRSIVDNPRRTAAGQHWISV